MRHTHKIHPEMLVELSVSLFDSLAEFIIGLIGVYIIVYSQTNSSVGVMKKKKKKKKKMEKIVEVRPISVCNCSGTLGVSLGRESLANHDHIPKKGSILKVCACEGFSYVLRHRRVCAIPT